MGGLDDGGQFKRAGDITSKQMVRDGRPFGALLFLAVITAFKPYGDMPLVEAVFDEASSGAPQVQHP